MLIRLFLTWYCVVAVSGQMYVSEVGNCPASWTRPPNTQAECKAAVDNIVGTPTAVQDYSTIAGSGSTKLAIELSYCFFDGVYWWNVGGTPSNTGMETVYCVQLFPRPTPEPPFVLPPFDAPIDSTTPNPNTVTGPVTATPPATVLPTATTATVTLPVFTPIPPAGPRIIDVSTTSETASNGACIEFSTWNVQNSARSASSTLAQTCPPCTSTSQSGVGFHKGMLNDEGWVAGTDIVPSTEWYQMNTGSEVLIQGVVLQGGHDASINNKAWVTTLTLTTSVDGLNWVPVDGGRIFTASSNADTQVAIKATAPILSSYIRVFPKSWVLWPSLRAGVLVCTGRATTIGGVTIRFDMPTNYGIQAANAARPNSEEGAYNTLRYFGVSGLQQTLGRPEGFTGYWSDTATYLINFNSKFSGRIDPLVASFYIRADAGLQSATGAASTAVGPTSGARFTNQPFTTPLELPNATTPVDTVTDQPSESNDDIYGIIAAIITGIIFCIIVLCCAYHYYRKSAHKREHEEWVTSGIKVANNRASRSYEGTPPLLVSPTNQQSINPIQAAFPQKGTS